MQTLNIENSPAARLSMPTGCTILKEKLAQAAVDFSESGTIGGMTLLAGYLAGYLAGDHIASPMLAAHPVLNSLALAGTGFVGAALSTIPALVIETRAENLAYFLQSRLTGGTAPYFNT